MNEKRTMSYDLIAGILFVAVALHSLMGDILRFSGL